LGTKRKYLVVVVVVVVVMVEPTTNTAGECTRD
jgi:hypothetical protein